MLTTKFVLKQPFIELYKILKITDLVSSGGEAKHVVADGLVKVGGEVETRKRKKIKPGDEVEFAGRRIVILDFATAA